MALVNTYPYTLLTRAILPKLKARKQKSLILSICSVISSAPSSYDALYAATKVFEVYQLESLRIESIGSSIDFLIMNPQYVSTNNARLTPGGLVETSEAFANVTMAAVGKTNESCGTWKHILFGYIIKQIDRTFSRSNWH